MQLCQLHHLSHSLHVLENLLLKDTLISKGHESTQVFSQGQSHLFPVKDTSETEEICLYSRKSSSVLWSDYDSGLISPACPLDESLPSIDPLGWFLAKPRVVPPVKIRGRVTDFLSVSSAAHDLAINHIHELSIPCPFESRIWVVILSR